MAFQILWKIQKSNIFALRINGLVAEWLGRGLQNLVQRFESARDLQNEERSLTGAFFYFSFPRKPNAPTSIFLVNFFTFGVRLFLHKNRVKVTVSKKWMLPAKEAGEKLVRFCPSKKQFCLAIIFIYDQPKSAFTSRFSPSKK